MPGIAARSRWKRVGAVMATTVGVGPYPAALAVDLSTDAVYTANDGEQGGTVSVVDPHTATVTARIEVGRDPKGVAVDSSNHNVYVANFLSSTVSVIDESGDARSGTVGTGRVVVDRTP